VRLRIIAVLAVLALAASAMGYLSFRRPGTEGLPNPNGYDDFVAAGRLIWREPPVGTNASIEECRAFLLTNRAALDQGRAGLNKVCRVPTEFFADWLGHHRFEMTATRILTRTFCVEGNLARMEHRPGDAAASYLAAVNIGARLAHGGIIFDGNNVMDCEGEAELRILAAMRDFDSTLSRHVISELDHVQAEEEPSREILKHEDVWEAAQVRSYGLIYSLEVLFKRGSLVPDEVTQQQSMAQYNDHLKWTMELKAELAAHAYLLEHGRLATNWSELVPGYLKSVPGIPFPCNTNQLSLMEWEEALEKPIFQKPYAR
jgi:hypothetical protein